LKKREKGKIRILRRVAKRWARKVIKKVKIFRKIVDIIGAFFTGLNLGFRINFLLRWKKERRREAKE
jgi:hypothetical protein